MSSESQQRPTHTAPRPDDEISLWDVLAVLIRRRWTIVLTTFVVGVISVGTGYVKTYYSTFATFRPQGGQSQGGSELAALATQFGVSVPTGGSEEASSQFYVELLRSRTILHTVASEPYDVEELGPTSLVELLDIDEGTPELDMREVLFWMESSAVSPTLSAETGTVTLNVVTEWPEVSYEMATRLLDEIIDFNMTTRRSRAAEERRFIQARVDSAQVELFDAEDDLQAFLEANRRPEDSPLLMSRMARLQRVVQQKQSVLTGLVQSFEQARIAEVRDTPVITVMVEPFMPPGRDARGTILRAAVGFVLGVSLGALLALVFDAISRPAAGDPSREDFQESWNAFVSSIPILGRARG